MHHTGPPSEAESDTREVFVILAVCSGNICRSPQAAQLLNALLPTALGVDAAALRVSSAGTHAIDGTPMDAHAAAEAVRMGIADPMSHVARRLTAVQVAEADLVLGMTRSHRGAALRLVPNASRRTFTLVELERILEELANGHLGRSVEPFGDEHVAAFLRRVVEQVAVVRGLLPLPGTPDELDIEDPYGRTHEAFRRSAEAVDDGVARVTACLHRIATARSASAPRADSEQ